MAEFRMPSLGADMESGILQAWHVAVGDTVKRGDIVADVDTDKAVIEVETFATGTVRELLVPEGERVPVGTPLAIIAEDEAAGAGEPAAAAPTPAQPEEPGQAPPEAAALPPAEASGPAEATGPAEAAASSHPDRPQPDRGPAVSPLGRRRAHQLGVDLHDVTGTGHFGAITATDVERYAERHPAQPAPEAATAPAERAAETTAGPRERTAGEPETRPAPEGGPEPGSAADRQARLRRAIAASMARSKREIPHYYVSAALDVSAAMSWLADHNAAVSVTERVLPAALLLKATALALRKNPRLNGFYADEAFRPGDGIHLGVAIALRGGGLVAPAIRDADTLPLPELMRRLRDLVGRAKAGRLRSSEFADPTITVTNLGDACADEVLPVIYPPQVAIVGFGRIRERPWAQSGGLFVRPVVTATLAADHRVNDGLTGAAFLGDLDRVVANPDSLLEA